MNKIYTRYQESKFLKYLKSNQKYAPLFFFIAGFIWDGLTLGRIDRMYDVIILCSHISLLTISLYLFNVVDLEKSERKFVKKYGDYLPLAIQFFLGGLSSAYVIYFSRSVSLSKTVAFFLILLLLFIANEFLRKRISNKYLQFGFYFFVNFIFFSLFIPIILSEMNTTIFLISGFISLLSTALLIVIVYKSNVFVRAEIIKTKMLGLILSIYIIINLCYFLKLIPPVPLALDQGLVAYDIQKENGHYKVTYEVDEWYYFWKDHKTDFIKQANKPVYVFTSVFAPTDLKKKIYHRWKWFDTEKDDWKVIEDIGFHIIGGRDNGFRGYTYKNNIWKGDWKVEVITEEELVIGVVGFNIDKKSSFKKSKLVTKKF